MSLDTTKPNVLYAEDEDANFYFISELCEMYDLNLLRAHNGAEAVNFCKENEKVDLVLMDINLGKMTGTEAAKQIKQFAPDIPIVAITAHTSFDPDDNTVSGFDDLLPKPFSLSEFDRKIKKFLDV